MKIRLFGQSHPIWAGLLGSKVEVRANPRIGLTRQNNLSSMVYATSVDAAETAKKYAWSREQDRSGRRTKRSIGSGAVLTLTQRHAKRLKKFGIRDGGRRGPTGCCKRPGAGFTSAAIRPMDCIQCGARKGAALLQRMRASLHASDQRLAETRLFGRSIQQILDPPTRSRL